jgi:hypothetical protein
MSTLNPAHLTDGAESYFVSGTDECLCYKDHYFLILKV